jgi:DNA-binding transcriptional regulator LsrR (DeoR family)
MQPHGVKLPPDKRAELARRAWAMFNAGKTRREIEAELDLSLPTVRNLINFGRHLVENKPPEL